MSTLRPALTDALLKDALSRRAAGPHGAAELIDDVSMAVRSTTQGRGWGIGILPVDRPFVLFATTALLLFAVIAGALLVGANPFRRDPEQTLTENLAFPRPGPLPIGTYGAIVNGVSFTFPVSLNGWASSPTIKGQLDATIHGGWSGQRTPLGSAWVRFWEPDNVYADPCAHTPMSPPVGRSAADLAAAMAAIPGTVASGPVNTTVGGFPAEYVELTIADDIPCRIDSFDLWYDGAEGSDGSPRRPAAHGSTIRVWIVDIDGVRFIIDSDVHRSKPDVRTFEPGEVFHGDGTEYITGINTLVDSAEFLAIPADVLEYHDQVLTVCTATSERFGSDPDVVGGFRESAPEFTALVDAAAHAAAAARISDDAIEKLRAIPVPSGLTGSRLDEAYSRLESAIDVLRNVAAATRAGDTANVESLLTEAYRLTNQAVPRGPVALDLLAPSLSGCRLPSLGG